MCSRCLLSLHHVQGPNKEFSSTTSQPCQEVGATAPLDHRSNGVQRPRSTALLPARYAHGRSGALEDPGAPKASHPLGPQFTLGHTSPTLGWHRVSLPICGREAALPEPPGPPGAGVLLHVMARVLAWGDDCSVGPRAVAQTWVRVLARFPGSCVTRGSSRLLSQPWIPSYKTRGQIKGPCAVWALSMVSTGEGTQGGGGLPGSLAGRPAPAARLKGKLWAEAACSD